MCEGSPWLKVKGRRRCQSERAQRMREVDDYDMGETTNNSAADESYKWETFIMTPICWCSLTEFLIPRKKYCTTFPNPLENRYTKRTGT